jgi:hypothetical protein
MPGVWRWIYPWGFLAEDGLLVSRSRSVPGRVAGFGITGCWVVSVVGEDILQGLGRCGDMGVRIN